MLLKVAITQIAYHFDKPMLVTDVGGLRELVPHNKVGYVCEPNAKVVARLADSIFSPMKNKQATVSRWCPS